MRGVWLTSQDRVLSIDGKKDGSKGWKGCG